MKSCIVKTAESTVGRARQKQPDWFVESTDTLLPLIEMKNEAQKRMLQNNSTANRKEFRRQQRVVKEAIQSAKEKWSLRVASEGEKASKDGRTRWKCIRKLQLTHAGRRPAKPCAVLKEDGVLTASPAEVRLRWHRHFSRLLNIPSVFQEEVITEMLSQPVCWELDIPPPPTEEELGVALDKLKCGKAGGRTGILPEMILAGGKQLWSRLHQLLLEVYGRNTGLLLTGKMHRLFPFQRRAISISVTTGGVSVSWMLSVKSLLGSCRSGYRPSQRKSFQNPNVGSGVAGGVLT